MELLFNLLLLLIYDIYQSWARARRKMQMKKATCAQLCSDTMSGAIMSNLLNMLSGLSLKKKPVSKSKVVTSR